MKDMDNLISYQVLKIRGMVSNNLKLVIVNFLDIFDWCLEEGLEMDIHV